MWHHAVSLSSPSDEESSPSVDDDDPNDSAALQQPTSSPSPATVLAEDLTSLELEEDPQNHRLDADGKRLSQPPPSTGSEAVIMETAVLGKPPPPPPPMGQRTNTPSSNVSPAKAPAMEPLPPLPPPSSPPPIRTGQPPNAYFPSNNPNEAKAASPPPGRPPPEEAQGPLPLDPRAIPPRVTDSRTGPRGHASPGGRRDAGAQQPGGAGKGAQPGNKAPVPKQDDGLSGTSVNSSAIHIHLIAVEKVPLPP